MAFSDRLKKAAEHAKVEWSQTAIAKALDMNKQTVDRWFGTGEPKPAQIYRIADRWGVDPRWLATGEGGMLPRPSTDGLEPVEEELLARYREADPRWKLSLRLLSHLATEEQIEAAADVNVVMARIFGKRPREIRPVSNRAVERAFGDAPHVAARKAKVKESK